MENNIRIGKDFNVQWAINKVVDGERLPYDLVGKELQLYIVNDNGRKEVAGWKVQGNVIQWTFLGKDQKRLGAYQLVLVENAGKEGMVTVDTCKAFNLVAHSCEENVDGGSAIVIETVTLESEVALAHLRGPQGEQGPVGPQGPQGPAGPSYDDTELRNAIAEIQTKDTQTDAKLTELSTEVNEVAEKIDNINPTPMVSVTYAELVDLRDNGELVPGMQYRITDFVTTSVQENTRSAGNQFDIIVTADSANTLNEVARACLHEGDTYFSGYGAKLEAWQIWYSLDNDATRFAWAANPETQYVLWHEKNILCAFRPMEGYYGEYQVIGSFDAFGNEHYCTPDFQVIDESEMPEGSCEIVDGSYFKGVIYRMIDEHGNECPYDFKNIQFYTECYEDGTPASYEDGDYFEFLYTFSWMAEGRSHDLSLEFVDLYTDEGFATRVSNNIIRPYYSGDELQVQVLNRIVLGDSFECEYGAFYSIYNNIIDAGCYRVILSVSCHNNTIGPKCSYIYMRNSDDNSLGSGCVNITLQRGCSGNVFLSGCHHIDIQEVSQKNEFCMGVHDLDFIGNLTLYNCVFEAGINNLKVKCDANSNNDSVLNYRFCSGLYNATVDVYPNQKWQTYVVVSHGNGRVLTFALSDLANS